MSILPNQTNINNDTYFFLLVDAKVINTSTINANTGLYDKLFVNSISTGSVLVNSISSLTGSISSLTTNFISTGSITSQNFTTQNGFISSLYANSILTSSVTADTGVFTSSITADTGFFSTLSTTNLIAETAFISSINNSTITQFDASRWSLFKAISDVEATLIPPDPFFPLLFPTKQYDIKDFRDLYIRNVIATADNTAGGGIYSGNVGNIGIINGAIVNSTERNSVGIANSNGLIEVNGVNKLAGFNALSVTGGVTLSGGGTIHGITLGTQPVSGIDSVRLELLPLGGIFLTTPVLPITVTSGSAVLVTAGGALTLTSGGILSLAGGDRIEYNTDENRFINSSAGNDFTDILVGNIFPAFGGSANLRINGGGSGRGVELSNVKSIYLPSNESSVISGISTLVNVRNLTADAVSTNILSTTTVFADYVVGSKSLFGLSTFTKELQLLSLIYTPWDPLTTYNVGDKVEYLGVNYDCVSPSLNLPPTGPIVVWTRFIVFEAGNITYQSTGAGAGSYRCLDAYNGLPTPSANPTYFVKISTNNLITNFWVPGGVGGNSRIVGDELSLIRVGSGFYNSLTTSTINVSSINSAFISSINTDSIVANSLTVSYIQSKDIDNTSLLISALENVNITSGVDTVITGNQNVSLLADNLNFIGSNGISGTGDWNYNFYNLNDVGSITADTLNSLSTNTSTITANSIFIKGANEPFLSFYKPSDQDFPIGIIGGTDELGLTILAPSSITIQALQDVGVVATSNLLLAGENVTIQSGTNIQLDATDFVTIPQALFASSIYTFYIEASNVSSFITTTKELYTYSIGHPNPLEPTPILVNNFLDFGSNSIFALDFIRGNSLSTSIVSTGRLYAGAVITPNLSTNNFSTGSLCAGAVSTLQLGASSINANTVRATTVATDRITGSANVNNTFTQNLFPSFATSGVGFGPTTAGGGFYAQGCFRSTFTSVIQPDTVAGQLSNVVRVNGILSTNILTTQYLLGAGPLAGNSIYTNTLLPNFLLGSVNIGNAPINSFQQGWFNTTYTNTIQANTGSAIGINSTVRVLGTLSTQNQMISSINLKQYPYTSTLNIPFSSFSITGNQAGTPILLYSNVDFRTQGFHRISQKSILSKNSGGASADIHANIFYTVGAFPSTPSITDGYSALPLVSKDNASSFTTCYTEFYVSTPTTRNILYYDSTANNYTAKLYMGTLFDTVTPDFGNNPTRIPSVL